MVCTQEIFEDSGRYPVVAMEESVKKQEKYRLIHQRSEWMCRCSFLFHGSVITLRALEWWTGTASRLCHCFQKHVVWWLEFVSTIHEKQYDLSNRVENMNKRLRKHGLQPRPMCIVEKLCKRKKELGPFFKPLWWPDLHITEWVQIPHHLKISSAWP